MHKLLCYGATVSATCLVCPVHITFTAVLYLIISEQIKCHHDDDEFCQ